MPTEVRGKRVEMQRREETGGRCHDEREEERDEEKGSAKSGGRSVGERRGGRKVPREWKKVTFLLLEPGGAASWWPPFQPI